MGLGRGPARGGTTSSGSAGSGSTGTSTSRASQRGGPSIGLGAGSTVGTGFGRTTTGGSQIAGTNASPIGPGDFKAPTFTPGGSIIRSVQQLNAIQNSISQLPANIFAFRPVTDQAGFLADVTGISGDNRQTATVQGLPPVTSPGVLSATEAAAGFAGSEARAQLQATEKAGKKAIIGTTAAALAGVAAITAGFALAGSLGASHIAQLVTHTPAIGVGITTTGRVVANNTANYATKASFLTRLASTAAQPKAVLALLSGTLFTSLFWAPNEKGDALTTLTITQNQAAKIGDIQTVQDVDTLIQETLDISAGIPAIGFIQAELAKFKAAAASSDAAMRSVGLR